MMEMNGENTSTSSCDNDRNDIDSQRRQNGGYGSSTREHSSRPVDRLTTNGWERVSEGPFTSQATSKRRKGTTDHSDNAHAIPFAALLKKRRRNKGRKRRLTRMAQCSGRKARCKTR
ncbi:unnamed protein product [Thelazia callipaeda]|uniref:Uncharacterized protein n=1 Tax=Thelazia callipaeda TaxID=103827 RepID=A0A0N5D876_THECL|nr:unnamed protein product [Thelazia callipaeda]